MSRMEQTRDDESIKNPKEESNLHYEAYPVILTTVTPDSGFVFEREIYDQFAKASEALANSESFKRFCKENPGLYAVVSLINLPVVAPQVTDNSPNEHTSKTNVDDDASSTLEEKKAEYVELQMLILKIRNVFGNDYDEFSNMDIMQQYLERLDFLYLQLFK